VADGAGSASRADEGASLVCSFMYGALAATMAAHGCIGALTRDVIVELLRDLRDEIAFEAAAAGVASREFASTLLGAVVGLDEATFFQIGDGAIVVAAEDEADGYSWIFWPERGEYEGMTAFVTDPEVESHLQWERCARPCDQVALLSDGLQRLALDFATHTAHAPFFRSKMQAIEAAPNLPPEELSRQLERFLASPEVNARTDDDKTLVLATRRRAPAPPPAIDADDDGAEALR
jgi:hypothetical protein